MLDRMNWKVARVAVNTYKSHTVCTKNSPGNIYHSNKASREEEEGRKEGRWERYEYHRHTEEDYRS